MPPESKSFQFEASVRDLSDFGLGVANAPNGKVYFIEGVWPGETGVFESIEEKKHYGRARLLELRIASPARRAAPCKFHGTDDQSCGGCPWMFVSYEAQLSAKEDRIRRNLEKTKLLGPGVSHPVTLLPIMGSDRELGYRNRAQFKTDGTRLGYVASGTRHLIPIDACPILNDPMETQLEKMLERLPNPDWKPTGHFQWNFVDVDDEMTPGVPPALNERRPFKQGNPVQNEKMRAWLFAKLKETSNLDRAVALELFDGSGNFTGVLLQSGAARVLAAEFSAQSLEKLQLRHPKRVDTLVCDLAKPYCVSQLAPLVKDVEFLLLDPPREGFEFLETLVSKMPRLKTIAYISCDFSTFLRDARRLLAKEEFRLQEVQPLDLFPQTLHIETLSLFTRV